MRARSPCTSRLFGEALGQDAAQAKRVVAQLRTHPVAAGGGRVAFVENEVDDLQHRSQPGGELIAARDLEGDLRLGEE